MGGRRFDPGPPNVSAARRTVNSSGPRLAIRFQKADYEFQHEEGICWILKHLRIGWFNTP
jgi:hypothetical protein